MVKDALVDGLWSIEFRMQLNESLFDEWNRLLELMGSVVLTEGKDLVTWNLDKSSKYSARSLYKFMTNGGITDNRTISVRKCCIPLKVKIFIWMATHDRIQCAVQLKKKKWSGQESALCVASLKPLTIYFSNVRLQCFLGPS